MLTTTPSALLLIKAFEGFEPQTYFDSVGVATIGFGTTKFANGDKPEIGDEITEDEAEAELFHYIRQEVEPVMNEHFEDIPLQPNQRDALASFLYNLGGDESKWPTLKKLIRNNASDEKIADQLLKYRKAGGKVLLGLHRRRIAEALVWMGMAWDRASQLAQTAELTDDWRKFVPTKSLEPQIDPEIFEPEQGAPVNEPITDPTPETPLTTEDLNNMQAEALRTGRKIAITPVTPKVPLENYEYLSEGQKAKPEVKDVRDSQRGRSVGKKAISKGTGAAGVGGAVAVATGTAEPVLKIVDKYPKETLAYVAVSLIVIGIIYHFWSEWQLQKGRDEADTLLG